MRDYPKNTNTKQDFDNLLALPESRDQSLAELNAIRDLDDRKATRATEPINPSDPESEWKTEIIDNPLPLWKQKGFPSRKAVASLITKAGA